MNNLYDVLEICLQELENGADLEIVLGQYPDLANKLRPVLKASMTARSKNVPPPSAEVTRRGRVKLLQHAMELREQKTAPRKRMIPIFQRLAISLTLTGVFLASGTGLVGASSSALPGENLYPVKRTWEDVRLFFVFDQRARNALKNEFENERLHEVSNLLVEGRDETIQFSGIFTQVNGVKYVSGVTVLIPSALQIPANGAAVLISGTTNAQRFVEIQTIELLPNGVIVPVGSPVERDKESNPGSTPAPGSENRTPSKPGSGSEDGAVSGSGNGSQANDSNTAPKTDSQSFGMNGNVTSISNNILIVNGQSVQLDKAQIDGVLKPGVNVAIKGFYAADGSFVVTYVKVESNSSGGESVNQNPGSEPNPKPTEPVEPKPTDSGSGD